MRYWPSAISRQGIAFRFSLFASEIREISFVILSDKRSEESKDPYSAPTAPRGIRTRTLFRFYRICGIMSMSMIVAVIYR